MLFIVFCVVSLIVTEFEVDFNAVSNGITVCCSFDVDSCSVVVEFFPVVKS